MRLLLLVLFAILASDAVAQGSRVFAGDGKVDRRKFDFYLTPADIAKIAPWPVEARNASASPKDAITIARRQLSRLVSPRIRWELHRVGLKEVAPDRWVYVVWCTREYPPTIAVYGADYFEIPVSMRGATYQPQVKPF